VILPTKHTNLEQSFIGFGGYILKSIDDGLTIDDLWMQYKRDFSSGKYAVKQSFDNLLLVLVFLFSIGAIYNEDGKVIKCS
jgi:hypothetical protein